MNDGMNWNCWVLISVLLFWGTLSCAGVDVKDAEELQKLIENGTTTESVIELRDHIIFSQEFVFPLGDKSGTCKPLSGVLHGNGHSIRCKGMPSNDQKKYTGVFCGLSDVKIDNLVIGASCFFGGSYGGALSKEATGSVFLENVTNMAEFNGSSGGGFIGQVRNAKEKTILSFNRCRNEGSIEGSSSVGGFVAKIQYNPEITVNISECTNDGTVTGKDAAGGGYWKLRRKHQCNSHNSKFDKQREHFRSKRTWWDDWCSRYE